MKPETLMQQAVMAMKNAYCPYSKFRVGAALLCADGKIYTGCNVENASYGLTICAERAAFANAIADGNRKFKAIAIVAGGKTMPHPCGACRQVMVEFCGPAFTVYMATESTREELTKMSLRKLLPSPFNMQAVKRPKSKQGK